MENEPLKGRLKVHQRTKCVKIAAIEDVKKLHDWKTLELHQDITLRVARFVEKNIRKSDKIDKVSFVTEVLEDLYGTPTKEDPDVRVLSQDKLDIIAEQLAYMISHHQIKKRSYLKRILKVVRKFFLGKN